MKTFVLSILRRLSWIEDYLPAKFSIQLRYFLQRYLGFLEPEFDLLPILSDPRKQALDVGANTGVFSYRLSRLACAVQAFEPIEWLAKRIEAARLPNVHVNCVALSDSDSVSSIKIPVMNGIVRHTRASLDANNEGAIEQQVVLKPLDSFDFDNVGFVKIDVEGHEYPLLVGAEKTILKNRPNIFIEIEHWRMSGTSVKDIFDLFLRWNYRGFFYWRGKLLTLDDFDASLHQAQRDNTYKHADYVNNFIFLPSESSLTLPATVDV